ncbi:MAG: putative sugar nucleotidyl transferase [Bacteroidales bacterium]|jgi:UDP-N-acetylglucosamine diphosphorylase/glucosamine-1-phosphate N-acetyltransferase
MSNYILFDETSNRISLRPLTYFKPISQLRVGILTIEEKWKHYFKAEMSNLSDEYLSEIYPLNVTDDNILINSSVLPDPNLFEAIKKLKKDTTLTNDGFLIAIRLTAKNLASFSSGETSDLDSVEYSKPYDRLKNTWDFVKLNKQEIINDFELITFGRESAYLSESNMVYGNNYFVEPNADVEGCSIDTRQGPVYIGKNATVMQGSLIRGPVAIGDTATVKMGALLYEGTSVGPHCKIGGEVGNSILMKYSSKVHHGYLGDSVIGEWCNLGAGTTISNLKNNYSTVKMWDYEKEKFVDTKMQFLGLVLGDHCKTGINTMFNTGTVVGVCCNLFDSGYHRNFVPSFSWGRPSKYQDADIEQIIQTAEIVMKRRNVEISQNDIDVFKHIKQLSSRYKYL